MPVKLQYLNGEATSLKNTPPPSKIVDYKGFLDEYSLWILSTLVAMFSLISPLALAQYYTPSSTLIFDKVNINLNYIQQKISEKKTFYTKEDIVLLKQGIQKNKNILTSKISLLNENMVLLNRDREGLLKPGDLKNQMGKIDSIILKYKMSIHFDKNNIESTTDAAIKFLEMRMEQLRMELLYEKEKELLAKYEVNVPIKEELTVDLAKKAVSLYEKIPQGFSNLEDFMEVIQEEKHVTTHQGQKKSIYREVSKIWLYPVPVTHDHFSLTLVAQFSKPEIRQQAEKIPDKVKTSACYYAINPTHNLISSKGGTFSFNISTAPDCQWAVLSKSLWVKIISTANGLGNATLSYFVEPNTENKTRTAKIKITKKDYFTITQSGKGMIVDIDGNTYNTIAIGSQLWMKENLKVTKYNNGDLIGTSTPADLVINSEVTPKYQWAYLGDESYVTIYGRLYTWYAVTDNRKVCPTGWHVPSNDEWRVLTDYLQGENVAGGKMKEAGTRHWRSLNYEADNSSGFSAIPGGFRYTLGGFHLFGANGYWWSASESSAPYAWSRSLSCTYAKVYPYDDDKSLGYSVRCICDTSR